MTLKITSSTALFCYAEEICAFSHESPMYGIHYTVKTNFVKWHCTSGSL